MSRINRPVTLPVENHYASLALYALLAPGQKLTVLLPSEDQARRVYERARATVERAFEPLPLRDPLAMAQLEDSFRCLGGPS